MSPDQLGTVLSSQPTVTALGAEAAQATMTELLDEHRLVSLGGKQVRMSLRTVREAGVGLDLLSYDTPVEIVSEGLGHFHLLQIPLRGRSMLRIGAREMTATPSIASLPPLHEPFAQRWEGGSPHLLVYFEHVALARASDAFGFSDAGPTGFDGALALGTERGQSLLRAVWELHDVLNRPTPLHERACSLASELFMIRLVEAMADPEPAASPSRGDHLYRRFVALSHEHADTGAGVVDLCRLLGVPLRTLQEHIRAACGSTPTALLRDVRMTRAYEALTAADPTSTTVTQIAAQYGFAHLGRFATDYRQNFGVSPSATLRGDTRAPRMIAASSG